MMDYQTGLALAHPILDRFKTLLYIPAPSSREQHMAQVITDQIQQLGLESHQDVGGSVTVTLAGQDPSLPVWCYAAHMDEIGMVVTRVRHSGDLEVTRTGGLYPWKLGETPVEIMGDTQSVLGILSMGSTHTTQADEKKIDWPDVWITTGLTHDSLTAAGVRAGTLVVPHASMRGPVLFGEEHDPLAAAWTFDDRLGCALLLELLAGLQASGEKPRHPTVIAFVHNEEVGGFGAKNLARYLQPEAFIAIDGAPRPPGTPLQVDHRPATWSKDALGHYDFALMQELRTAGQEVGVEVQSVVYERAASDASMVYTAGLAARALVFGCVRENSHGYEILRVSVLQNTLKTLHRFVTTR